MSYYYKKKLNFNELKMFLKANKDNNKPIFYHDELKINDHRGNLKGNVGTEEVLFRC